jgi:thiamine biosynthesis lipoprotein
MSRSGSLIIRSTAWLLLALMLSACSRPPEAITSRFLAFGTLVDLTTAGLSQEQSEAAADLLEKDFQRMHHAWHAWDPGPLGRVNRLVETGEKFSVPPSVMPLIQRGTELSLSSNRLFNPAIGHLIDAWGFHSNDPEGHRPPQEETIVRLLQDNPQMDDLELTGIEMRSANPRVKLDFGAFGKGYGIDLAIEHLKEINVHNAIVNAGGDLRAIGSRNGEPWRIGIRHPSGEGVLGTITTSGDESIFTSGDYERHFIWEGRRYHHIIDPRTGYPAQGSRSVTVIHPDAATADAAATALFIAGPTEWHTIARQMGIRYVMLVDEEGNIHMNPAMQKRVELHDTSGKIILSPPLRAD